MKVVGNQIFVIKLRDGQFKKLEIQEYNGFTFTFQYANLDGTDLVSEQITKADYAGKTLAYYSIENGNALDLEPAEWDLMFTRYVTPLVDPSGGILDYTVTGFLNNSGIQVAKATGIDPETVDEADYADAYNDTLTTVGYDWKSYQGSWVIPSDRVYFIKGSSNKIWKIQFLDFEGSSTGVATLQKTYLGDVTNINEEEYQNFNSLGVYPNPAIDFTHITIETPSSEQNANYRIYSVDGSLMQNGEMAINPGLNVNRIELDLPAGNYQLSVQIGQEIITRPLMIQN